jgi:hypothetical protein
MLMTERDRTRPNPEESADQPGGVREGLDREYASMGTGEAGGGVGGGGSSSSDVEWDEKRLEGEETAGGAMTNEQDFVEPDA